MSPPKDTRPPLEDVDLADLPGTIAPTDKVELRRRAALASSFEDPAFVARGADAGHIRLVRAAGAAEPQARTRPVGQDDPTDTSPAGNKEHPVVEAPQRRRRSEEPNFTVRLPEYVQQALRLRAVTEKTTVRLTLLRLLREAGYQVEDEDMTDDRGIVAKLRSRSRPQG